MQESDYPTEESKRKFIRDSFKMDENEIRMFLDNFLALELHNNHYGKTDLVELKIDLEP